MSPTAQQNTNPFAPQTYNGYNDASPQGYVDVDFTYPYDVVLTAGQTLTQQTVSTTNDADFEWRGEVVAFSTGSFNIRFSDSTGSYISSGYVASANIQGDASSPNVRFPGILIPAGGRIGIDIQDTSGSGNTIEILFRGVKRYRLAR